MMSPDQTSPVPMYYNPTYGTGTPYAAYSSGYGQPAAVVGNNNQTGFMGAIILLLLFALLMVVIIKIVTLFLRRNRRMVTTNGIELESHHAIDILKERYVRGEIDKFEYEEKRKDILAE